MGKRVLSLILATSLSCAIIGAFPTAFAATTDKTEKTQTIEKPRKLYSANIIGGKSKDPSGNSDKKGVLLRSSASPDGTVTNFVPNGENVILIATADEYYYVSAGYGYYVGYIPKANTSNKTPAFLAGKSPIGKVRTNTFLKKAIGIPDSRMLGENYEPAEDRIDVTTVKDLDALKKGTKVEWLDYFGDEYYLVRANGKVGFIPVEAFQTNDIEFRNQIEGVVFALASVEEGKDGKKYECISVSNKTSKVCEYAVMATIFYDKNGKRLDVNIDDKDVPKGSKGIMRLSSVVNIPAFNDGDKTIVKEVPDDCYYVRACIAKAMIDEQELTNPCFSEWLEKYGNSYFGE